MTNLQAIAVSLLAFSLLAFAVAFAIATKIDLAKIGDSESLKMC